MLKLKVLSCYQKKKKKIPIEYDEQAEMEIKEILLKLEELKQLSIPPPPKWKGICSKCGFSELCWAGGMIEMKPIYIFQNGTLSRKGNTLAFKKK